MNIVIIEDEQMAAARLERMIRVCLHDVQVLPKLESVKESVRLKAATRSF